MLRLPDYGDVAEQGEADPSSLAGPSYGSADADSDRSEALAPQLSASARDASHIGPMMSARG